MDAKARAAAAYDAAADHYDAPPLSFWERFGRRTVERLALSPSARVLDVCAGSGASALPAAERVGPSGRVVAVDLAGNLLELARRKAAARGLRNLDAIVGDIEALHLAPASFDAVVCVFGIFFLPDMPAGARTLWNLVRPGGQLAVTTWGPQVFEPGNTCFWEAVRAERPELFKTFNPWDQITAPAALAALLRAGGADAVDVVAEAGTHPLSCPEDWWTIVLGSGYRGTTDRLDTAARERVRARTLEALRACGAAAVQTNVVYAVARKPADG